MHPAVPDGDRHPVPERVQRRRPARGPAVAPGPRRLLLSVPTIAPSPGREHGAAALAIDLERVHGPVPTVHTADRGRAGDGLAAAPGTRRPARETSPWGTGSDRLRTRSGAGEDDPGTPCRRSGRATGPAA